MDLVWVQKGIVLWSKTKMLKGSVQVRVLFLVQVLHLHLRSLRFHCCYCCYWVQGQNIVCFSSLWCHLFVVQYMLDEYLVFVCEFTLLLGL